VDRVGQSHEACELLPKAGEGAASAASATSKPSPKAGKAKAASSGGAAESPRWERLRQLLSK
jgi:hypothetical protein